MLKKGIYLLVVAIMCTVLLYGCRDSGIEYNVRFSDNVGFGNKEAENSGITYCLTEIVDSLEELEALCEEWHNPAFDENNDDYSNELSAKIRGYDQEFFENEALIIDSSWRYNSAREPRVEKLTTEGGELIIEISLKRGTYTSVAELFLFIIEVNKTDVQDITNITIENTERSRYK